MADTPGTTLNNTPAQVGGLDFGRLTAAIKQQESSGDYNAVNRTSGALGAYQVMPFNLSEWGKAAGYPGITPAEFLANPAAQDAIAQTQLKKYASQYGNVGDVATAWYGGPKAVGNRNIPGGKGYPTTGGYASQVASIYNSLGGATGQPTSRSTAAASAPTTPTGGQGAPAGTGQPAAGGGGLADNLPGFTPGSPGAKMAAQGLQSLTGGGKTGGGGGGGDEPQPLVAQNVASPAMASGGGMMMGAGGQNTMGELAAQQMMQQRGFLTRPSMAAFANNPTQSVVPSTLSSTARPAPIGGASGAGAGLPGTTLNSPSQLQYALSTGYINPYDYYSSGGGAQFGSS